MWDCLVGYLSVKRHFVPYIQHNDRNTSRASRDGTGDYDVIIMWAKWEVGTDNTDSTVAIIVMPTFWSLHITYFFTRIPHTRTHAHTRAPTDTKSHIHIHSHINTHMHTHKHTHTLHVYIQNTILTPCTLDNQWNSHWLIMDDHPNIQYN